MACDHRGCDCKEATVRDKDKQFCSDFCRNATTTGQHADRCKCGHPDCRGTKS
jgi:hypothetical protein